MVRAFRFEMAAWRGLPFLGRHDHAYDVMRRFTTSDSARAMGRFCGPGMKGVATRAEPPLSLIPARWYVGHL
jgi:hypothetical protein